ncbi:binding partner of ACD11 1-like [Malus sylvestris]|uniref:binding partner of ACD11 1-like n=1 Tax=Malus sylvestris TaxID=3752 RepID=UPI0021AD48CA|nr:binding partner of ACD11 1-like [Malus sylvestris]
MNGGAGRLSSLPSEVDFDHHHQLLSTPTTTSRSISQKVTTIKVNNLSLGASERDIKEFFSFSGDIVYVETMSDTERSQIAYVTFKDVQGAETAVLISILQFL